MLNGFLSRRAGLKDHDPLLSRFIVFLGALVSSLAPLLFWPAVNAEYATDADFWIGLGKTWLLVQGVFLVVHTLDYHLLSATKKNLQICRERGFSWGEIIGGCLHTYFGAEILVILSALWNRGGIVHFDFTLFWHLAVVVLLSDIPFYFSHRALHRSLPNHHKLHHCCMHPTFTTNLFFHPVDLYIEFSAPLLFAMILLGTNVVGLHDPFAAFLAPVIQQGWYLMGHDSFIKNSHFIHHRYISSNYWIYNELDQSKDPQDRVRHVLGLGPMPKDGKVE